MFNVDNICHGQRTSLLFFNYTKYYILILLWNLIAEYNINNIINNKII